MGGGFLKEQEWGEIQNIDVARECVREGGGEVGGRGSERWGHGRQKWRVG